MLAVRGTLDLQRKTLLMPNGSTINETPTGLSIRLPAEAENVAVVRHAIAGMAEQLGMDEAGLADLKTVVTEACMNAVVHAYPEDDKGPLDVEAEPERDGLTVTVRDRGAGISPKADSERPSLKLGLSLIAALSSTFSIAGGLGRGTEVTMRIPLQGGGANSADDGVQIVPEAGGTEVTVGRAELLEPVLARMVGTLAARRDLPVDRVSDAVLVTDAIADAAPGRFADGCVRLGLGENEHGIELRLGPMEKGGAGAIREELAVPEVGGSLEALADGLQVDESDDGEYLIVHFAAPRSG